jgi:hypothetical protein
MILASHGPSGVIAVTQPHAPRLSTLTGARVGFVSNEQWQAYRMLPRVKALLEADVLGIEGIRPTATGCRATAPASWAG